MSFEAGGEKSLKILYLQLMAGYKLGHPILHKSLTCFSLCGIRFYSPSLTFLLYTYPRSELKTLHALLQMLNFLYKWNYCQLLSSCSKHVNIWLI